MKKLVYLIIVAAVALSCQPKEKNKERTENPINRTGEQWGDFFKISSEEINENVIKLIGKDWMLITAGDEHFYNTMTASWGALGEIWSKPVSVITVRDSRYTYQFLQGNEYYTLSFFPEEYKEALTILGTKSGRDTDKIKESGLTPIVTPAGSMAFAEAKLVIECRKMYAEPFKKDSFTDQNIYEDIYVKGDKSIHTFYIGEIVNVWEK